MKTPGPPESLKNDSKTDPDKKSQFGTDGSLVTEKSVTNVAYKNSNSEQDPSKSQLTLVHLLLFTLYRWILAPLALLFALTLGGALVKKIRQGLQMRRKGAHIKGTLKGKGRPIWIHASSGEFEYAKPLIPKLRELFPNQPIMVTYFSPTYRSQIINHPGVDIALPLPFDLTGPVVGFLKDYRPLVALIARTDLWPELLFQCRSHQIPTLLFAATFSKNKVNRLLNRLWRFFLFNQLTQIQCVTEEDCQALLSLDQNLAVTAVGDTRYDQVFERLDKPRPLNEGLFTGKTKSPCLVAGSTWSEDERVLIAAVAPLVKARKLRLIIAPHEPTDSHLKQLTKQFLSHDVKSQLYSKHNHWAEDQVLIMDQVGLLAELYARGDLAFVGGSFKKTVHSVMEPLAAGCITFVGPLHQNNREALIFKNISLAPKETSDFKINMVIETQSTTQFSDQLRRLVSKQQNFPGWKQAIVRETTQRKGASLYATQWVSDQLERLNLM